MTAHGTMSVKIVDMLNFSKTIHTDKTRDAEYGNK